MSADTLRKAAALMREDEDDRWHPVAAWLDAIADGDGLGLTYPSDEVHAHIVARAFLGEAR